MTKKIISKIGNKRLPDIDMMEFIQLDEIKEFDLDKHYESTLCDDEEDETPVLRRG